VHKPEHSINVVKYPKEEISIADPTASHSYTTNTTITNNTNIVLVGGKSYMINTSGRSPPEVIEINPDKLYQMRTSCKTSDKNSGENINRIISHTKTSSEFHIEHSRKASRAVTNNSKLNEIHQSKSQAGDTKVAKSRAQNQQAVTIGAPKTHKKRSGVATPIKCSGIVHSRKVSTSLNPSKPVQNYDNSKAVSRPILKTAENTKESSIELKSVKQQLEESTAIFKFNYEK
jgi:hypothetical protein